MSWQLCFSHSVRVQEIFYWDTLLFDLCARDRWLLAAHVLCLPDTGWLFLKVVFYVSLYHATTDASTFCKNSILLHHCAWVLPTRAYFTSSSTTFARSDKTTKTDRYINLLVFTCTGCWQEGHSESILVTNLRTARSSVASPHSRRRYHFSQRATGSPGCRHGNVTKLPSGGRSHVKLSQIKNFKAGQLFLHYAEMAMSELLWPLPSPSMFSRLR